MHLLLKIVAKTLTQKPAVCLLLLLSLPSALSSQTRIVTATIDTAKTGPPISKNIYGQFLEHGGDIVNTRRLVGNAGRSQVLLPGRNLGAHSSTSDGKRGGESALPPHAYSMVGTHWRRQRGHYGHQGGDFEKYIWHDVVSYIDAHYRTIPDRTSRGLVGHSMGGYGASRIGMKHPDVFGALYIMSPCCMSSMVGGGPGSADQIKERAIASEKKVAVAKSPGDLAAQSPGFASAQYATAAAWAPNPKNPPLYFDLPTKDGVPQPEIVAKYAANSPLAFVDQYIGNLKQYRASSMDVGDQDGLRFDATKLHTILDNYRIANSFEIYSGTHVSAVADRFQNHVLPFFSKNLCFTADCR